MWQNLDLAKIRLCVENKSEFDKVFPGFLLELKKNLDARLLPKYPEVPSWFGPDCRPQMMEMNPELKEPIFLDWTCFGVEGIPLGACHVGLLFDLNNWPIKYRIGVHAYGYLWEPKADEIKAMRENIPGDYVYSYNEKITEHQLDDVPHELDLNNLDAEIKKICDRYEMIYEKARPLFMP